MLSIPSWLLLIPLTVCAADRPRIVEFAGSGAPSVEPLGETRERLTRVYQRLLSPPLSDAEFVLSDLNFHMERRFTEYSGDISGRMFNALSTAGDVLGTDPPLCKKLMAGFGALQKPDGHFGAVQDLAKEVSQARDMPILWGNGRLLLALAEHASRHPSPEALAIACKLGDYLISTRPHYGKRENFERVGGAYASGFTTCYPSLIDGLAALGKVTKEWKYLDEARFIGRLSLLDSELKTHHSHGRLTAYRGMLDVDRCLGTAEFLEPIRKSCDRVASEYLLPTGGVTERFDLTDVNDEGCADADWVRVCLLLWQVTDQPKYLDWAEMGLRNHLLAMQFTNGGFGHHAILQLHDGEKTYPGGGFGSSGSEAYWCCSMHGAQLLAELPRWGVVREGDAFKVTWMAEGRSRFKIRVKKGSDSKSTGTVNFEVQRREANRWHVVVNVGTASTEFALRLRVPGWADGIAIDGQAANVRDGWAELKQTWTGPKSIEVAFAAKVKPAGAYGVQVVPGEPVRLLAGGDLLCLPEVAVGADLLATDSLPHLIMSKEQADALSVTAILEGREGRLQMVSLVPMLGRPAGACRFLFQTRQVERAEWQDLEQKALPAVVPGVPLELIYGCEGESEVYLNGRLVVRHKHWGGYPRFEFHARPGENTLAIRTQSKVKRPGLVALIRQQARDVVVSGTERWTGVPCPAKVKPEWLVDVRQGAEGRVGLVDLGGFGAAPWNAIPGEFAGTAARWIWPKPSAEGSNPSGWLMRCVFEVAPK